LEKLGVTNDNAKVRAVGLGDGIGSVDADDRFGSNGRARGIVHIGAQKIPVETKKS